MPEVEPVRRCRGRAEPTITAREHFRGPGRGRIALTDTDEEPRDVAHHVVQEGIGCGLDGKPIALARDRQPLHAADRRFRLALRGPEGAEVMLTLEHRGRVRHGFGIERAMDPGGAMREQAGARRAIEDQISVRARLGRVARVKMRGYGAYPGNADITWQLGVGSQRPS